METVCKLQLQHLVPHALSSVHRQSHRRQRREAACAVDSQALSVGGSAVPGHRDCFLAARAKVGSVCRWPALCSLALGWEVQGEATSAFVVCSPYPAFLSTLASQEALRSHF